MLGRFIREEKGAVASEWVILTAATVGIGVAVAASVGSGSLSLGSTISAALSGAGQATSNALGGTLKTLMALAFDEDEDFDGWSEKRKGNSDYLGNFLGPFAGSDAELTRMIDLPPGATEAKIEFDLLILDSWDANSPQWSSGRGDGLALTIDGKEVAFELFAHSVRSSSDNWGHDRESTVTIGGTEYRTTMVLADQGRMYGNTWPDQVWTVQVEATNPPPGGFRFGLNSTTDQGIRDESFGVNNFSVQAR